MDEASAANVLLDAVDEPLGCLLVGWLKRRMNELLRVGRDSAVGGAVKADMLVVVLLAELLLLAKDPGAGKSLRAGS
jgi:hypothetical protein